MTREKFCSIAPLLAFLACAIPIPNEQALTAVICFVAGAAVACRFSLLAEVAAETKA